MNPTITTRDARTSDESAWRFLWDGYTRFYETTVSPEITAHTWQRILDPASPMVGRVAVVDGRVVGFSVSVVHDGTWSFGKVCYLEDLFVDPAARGQGVGRRLIQDLIDLGSAQQWSNLYWHTRADNPARKLYDEFAKADDFVRYRLRL